MSPFGRIAVALVAAVVFGFAAALVKGQSDGLRDALGNLSGPWLLVAFGCGCRVRSRAAGAAVGLAATLLALTGFCLGLALISDYGTASATADLHLAFRANTRYFDAGLISGPVLGALGAACMRSAVRPLLVAGILLLAESATMVAVRQTATLSSLIGPWSPSRTTACLVESLCGALLILAVLLRRHLPRRVGGQRSLPQ